MGLLAILPWAISLIPSFLYVKVLLPQNVTTQLDDSVVIASLAGRLGESLDQTTPGNSHIPTGQPFSPLGVALAWRASKWNRIP